MFNHSRASAPALFSSCRPPSNFVRGQELTMCDIVCTSPQSQRSLLAKPHFLWQALQCPWSVRKRFSVDHWRRGKSKPGSWIAGSRTNELLTTRAVCQSSCHRPPVSTVCISVHIGCLDANRCLGGWEMSLYKPHSLFSATLETRRSTAAFRRKAGGAIFERTGSHGRGVGQRVPVIRRIVELSCTSTNFVCAERAQTGAQYSPTE